MAINYAPLWQTMTEKGETTYTLKHKAGIGGGTYNRLRNNQSVSTHTINLLCAFLHCDVQDIMRYVPDP